MAEDRNVCVWQRGKLRQAKAVGVVCEPAGSGSSWVDNSLVGPAQLAKLRDLH